MSFIIAKFKLISRKYPSLLIRISWALNLFVIFYFGYISWWASVDFNGFTSMLFGIPILLLLLMSAYLAGIASEKKSQIDYLPKYFSQITFVVLILFYLTGFFPSLQKVTEIPIKTMTRLSKACTGKTPEQWVRPVNNI